MPSGLPDSRARMRRDPHGRAGRSSLWRADTGRATVPELGHAAGGPMPVTRREELPGRREPDVQTWPLQQGPDRAGDLGVPPTRAPA